MAQCAYCGSTIAFGGKREGELRFCNANCLEKGRPLIIAQNIPDDLALTRAHEIHGSKCPRCGGHGPVDVHASHTIWSDVHHTSWRSTPNICCRRCGIKLQLSGVLTSFVLGWWGFPAGLFVTPIQIGRNILGLLRPPPTGQPSEALIHAAKLSIAHQFIGRQRGRNTCPHCGALYELADYREDAPKILCSRCKGEIPRTKASNQVPEDTARKLADPQH